jgi:hypothetical protein
MEKLSATKTAQSPQMMSAVDDLKGYEAFAQAHVDGLKNLIASFDTLYAAFPDAQKKVADGACDISCRRRYCDPGCRPGRAPRS